MFQQPPPAQHALPLDGHDSRDPPGIPMFQHSMASHNVASIPDDVTQEISPATRPGGMARFQRGALPYHQDDPMPEQSGAPPLSLPSNRSQHLFGTSVNLPNEQSEFSTTVPNESRQMNGSQPVVHFQEYDHNHSILSDRSLDRANYPSSQGIARFQRQQSNAPDFVSPEKDNLMPFHGTRQGIRQFQQPFPQQESEKEQSVGIARFQIKNRSPAVPHWNMHSTQYNLTMNANNVPPMQTSQ